MLRAIPARKKPATCASKLLDFRDVLNIVYPKSLMYLFKYECRILAMHISDQDDAPVARAHAVGATTHFKRERERKKTKHTQLSFLGVPLVSHIQQVRPLPKTCTSIMQTIVGCVQSA